MRVLFSNPPWYDWKGPGQVGWRGVRAGSRWPHQFQYQSNGVVDGHIPELVGGYIPFPVFLATAAALAKRHGHDTELRDSVAAGETYDHYYAHVERSRPEVVVIETATPTVWHDLEVVDEIRRLVPPVVVIFTGMHVELEEASFLERHSQIDFTVVGEYEHSTVAILDVLEAGGSAFDGIDGILYRSQHGEVQGETRLRPTSPKGLDGNGVGACHTLDPTVSDQGHDGAAIVPLLRRGELEAESLPAVFKNDFRQLAPIEELPWAEREGVPVENYYDGVCGLERPQLQLMATRGCPYGCIFCGWPQMMYKGPKYRARTAQDVAAEIKANLQAFPYKSFYIDDDTVNIRKAYVLELATAIKEAGLSTTPWGTMGRADLMDDEMLAALRDAGLFSIKYGVETSDQELLNEIKKNISIDEVVDGIERTKRVGIRVHLTFTFGLPSDTPETIERTIQLACRLPVDTVQFSIATPYPGTEMYRLYKANGWLLTEDWADYLGSHRAVARTGNFTAEQLERAVQEAYSRFYEEQALRQLRTPEFERRLRTMLPDPGPGPTRVLVTQSARPGLTRVILKAAQNQGYEPHLLTHTRFLPSFEHVVDVSSIHTFDESFDFRAASLESRVAELVRALTFAAAVVPYHNATGATYEQVHAVATRLTDGPVVGVTVKGDVRTVRAALSSQTAIGSPSFKVA